MGKHSANSGGPFNRKRSAGRAAEHERRGLRTLDGAPTGLRTRERVGSGASRRTGQLEKAPARLKAERDRRRSRYKRAAVIAAVVVVMLLVGGIGGAWAWIRHLERTMAPSIIQEKLDASLEPAKPQKPYTVLILGGDKRRSKEPYRTDTMILAKVDPQTKRVWMLSIARDTRVEIPGHGSRKINQAFTYGGAKGAIDAVHKLTGVPINHYMQVDFKGFAKAVDSLGGVWVDVPVAIDDWAASSYGNHKAQRIDAGYQLLDGSHALTFVRARHQFVDQDFSRMKNQQIFFKALADQVAKSQNIAKLPRVVNSVAPYIETDMSMVEMVRTAQALRGAGSRNVFTATIPGEWRNPFVVVDEDAMELLVEKMKAGQSFEATKTPPPKAAEQVTEKTKTPKDIALTIRNGGGVSGSAKQASSILKARGFKVVELGNANQFVYDKTIIVYKDDEASAKQVALALAPGTKLVQSRGMYSFKSDVLVVIGKDWDLTKIPVTPIKTN